MNKIYTKIISLTEPVITDVEWVMIEVFLDSDQQAKIPQYMLNSPITTEPRKVTIDVRYNKYRISKLDDGTYSVLCILHPPSQRPCRSCKKDRD